MTKELYDKLICALMHGLEVCENCKKCDGANYAEIRMNLIKELAKEENKEMPWETDENEPN